MDSGFRISYSGFWFPHFGFLDLGLPARRGRKNKRSTRRNSRADEWGGEPFFSHGTTHSEGVFSLINPFAQPKIDHYYYAKDSGRIVLITITLNGQKLSLCNIYAPNCNDQVNQLQFMQELNNCTIDKSELTSLIAGGA